MKIIAMVAGLILCAGFLFQVQASCITTTPVKASKNKVNLVEENGQKVGYEMFDAETDQWFKAEAVGKDAHGLPIFDFTDAGKAAKEDHIHQDTTGGPGGGPH